VSIVASMLVRPGTIAVMIPVLSAFAIDVSATRSAACIPWIGWPRASVTCGRTWRLPFSGITITESGTKRIPAGCCFTVIRDRATCWPTTSTMLVAPGARVITVPSFATVAMVVSSLIHSSHEPTTTLPFLFVIVAARCSVSPTDGAVTAEGESPTHATPSVPTPTTDGSSPMTP
jgi:hypothetical protein